MAGPKRDYKRKAAPLKALAEALDSVKAGREQSPQLSDMIEHFFNLAGGSRAVAKMMLGEWNSSKPGSLVRTRIIETIMRATRDVNRMTGARDDMGMLTDEDLHSELGRIAAGAIEDEDEPGGAEQPAGPDAAPPVQGQGADADPAPPG